MAGLRSCRADTDEIGAGGGPHFRVPLTERSLAVSHSITGPHCGRHRVKGIWMNQSLPVRVR